MPCYYVGEDTLDPDQANILLEQRPLLENDQE
jgi:hypothetical protein